MSEAERAARAQRLAALKALERKVLWLSSWYAGRSFEPQFRQFAWAETGRWQTLRPGFFISNGSTVIYSEVAPGKSIAPEVWADLRLSERFDGSFSMTATRSPR